MLKVNCEKWNQTQEELRELGIKAEHPRTRERLIALYEISDGKSATKVGKETGRNPQTVMSWVHKYNQQGISVLEYNHSGGHPPLLSQGQKQAINQEIIKALAVSTTPPQERTEKPKPRWTLKRLVHWVKEKWKVSLCRETIRRILKKQGLSWKKGKKLLNKANPTKRKEFLLTLEKLFQEAIQDNHLLVYLDEAHIHLDCDLGYGWSIRGERFWVSSCSPGLQKVSFYGVYLYNEGNVRLFSFDSANQLNTIEVLKQLRVEFPERKITVIWDQAPYHRALSVKMAAATLDIAIEPLPSYSPDFMPVEHLWRWLREDVTYHTCYPTKEKLIQQVNEFVDMINLDPFSISDRLWAQNHLEPEEEKLRVST